MTVKIFTEPLAISLVGLVIFTGEALNEVGLLSVGEISSPGGMAWERICTSCFSIFSSSYMVGVSETMSETNILFH